MLMLTNSALDYRQTAIYTAGAGLGASKGKEIGKYTEGYSGYVHMAQDAVSVLFDVSPIDLTINDLIFFHHCFRLVNVMVVKVIISHMRGPELELWLF